MAEPPITEPRTAEPRTAEPRTTKRVAMVFSGGPAPAANAVISAAAVSFMEHDVEVLGFFHGYANLIEYDRKTNRMVRDEHYRLFEEPDLRGLRNARGVRIGTSRASPAAGLEGIDDLSDPDKSDRLRRVYEALVDLRVDAIISIGGDGTLRSANFLHRYQDQLPEGSPRVRVIHLPKTIDNDYEGIDFTFGFFTAVDVMAKELQNLRADAMATSSYFVVQTMGRKAGWLSYGVAIAGEANLVVGVEDVDEALLMDEDGVACLSLDKLADRIVDVILAREKRDEHFGVVVLAEGLSDRLPPSILKELPHDENGFLQLGRVELSKWVAERVQDRYEERLERRKKVVGLQLGYESRCAPPHAFDVMLGSQLGIGAYRALVEEDLDGHMVSVTGQFDLVYVPFHELADPKTLMTEIRFIKKGSDFHRLARFLETRHDREVQWTPGRREEH